jgi:membrane-associated phospholipid phosphatase
MQKVAQNERHCRGAHRLSALPNQPKRHAMTDTSPPSDTPKGPSGELRDDRYVGERDLTHWYTPVGRVLETFAQWLNRRLGPNATLIITLVVGMLIAVVLSVVVVQVYDSVTDKDGVAGLDQPLLDLAIELRSPVLDATVTGYTDIAGPIGMPLIAVLVMLLLSIRRRSWTPVILILAAGGGSLLMTIAGKDLIGRVRPALSEAVPPYEYSPSFPSGHSLNAVVIAGVIAYLLILRQHSTRARVLTIVVAAVFAFTVGISRVFLGHHWFTDVVAGWALGALWLALVITAHRLYLTARKRHTATDGNALG